MLFNSAVFIFLFLPTILVGYHLLQKSSRRNLVIGWLILSSIVFYGYFRIDYLILFFALIVANYFIGQKLSFNYQNEQYNSKWMLILGLGLNLAVLGYYKYTTFFLSNVNVVFSTNFVFENIILPLGISFFIFQKIAYLVDCYQGKIKGYTFLDFCLFVMYFPQLVAGPIVHHHELIPQFHEKSTFQLKSINLAVGLLMFTIGLFKKVVIADNLQNWVLPGFDAASKGLHLSFLEAWGVALSFSFQIYFDFSGYSDMALGLAFMMGIKFPQNFNSPYQATNIIDFWRRWHMSLSRFLRDYVYIPLGGNRHGNKRRHLNLMITMLLGGLWHGASWTFVLWGALHGLYLIINHGWNFIKAKFGILSSRGTFFGVLITFGFVTIAWVFFRAQTLEEAIIIIKGMFGMHGVALPKNYEVQLGVFASLLKKIGVIFDDTKVTHAHLSQALSLALLSILVWLMPNTQRIFSAFSPTLSEIKPVLFNSLNKFNPISKIHTLISTSSVYLVPKLSGILGFFAGILLIGIMVYQALISEKLNTFIYFQF